MLFTPSKLFLWAAVVVGIFLAIESLIWRRFTSFVLNMTILLAIVTSLVLVWQFFWQLVILILIGIVVMSITRNLRELTGR
jgi:hypothetical protein